MLALEDSKGTLTPGVELRTWKTYKFATREEAEAWLELNEENLDIFTTAPDGNRILDILEADKPFGIFARERGGE